MRMRTQPDGADPVYDQVRNRTTMRRIKRVEVPVVPELPGMSEYRARRPSEGSRRSMPSSAELTCSMGSSHSSSSPSSSRAPSSCADPSEMTTSTFSSSTIGRNHSRQSTSNLSSFQESGISMRNGTDRNSTVSSNSRTSSNGGEPFKNCRLPYTESTSSFKSCSTDQSNYNLLHSRLSTFELGHRTRSDPDYGSYNVRSKPDISQMMERGVSDSEVLAEWLEYLGMQQYLPQFVTQGYDVSAVSRMTSEDLLALGIADPSHRRMIHSDIQTWNVIDIWPAPLDPSESTAVWLSAIGLPQYACVFEADGYYTVGQSRNICFEDLEDMGIKKLGHIKRIIAANKKLTSRRAAPKERHFDSPDSGFAEYASIQKPRRLCSRGVSDESGLHIITSRQILSAAPALPRAVNGDVLHIGSELDLASPPSPAPAPGHNAQPSAIRGDPHAANRFPFAL